MQALFCMDMTRDASEEMLQRFCQNFNPSDKVRPFFILLVSGVVEAQTYLDDLIERFSKNWKLKRMSGVDRNIMRIAVFEILFCGDIPPKVTINEAVEIGKKYGTDESGAFINGILDSVRIAYENQEISPQAIGQEQESS